MLVSVTTVQAQSPHKKSTTTRPVPKPDLLVRRDGTQLEVLVTEITDNEVVYKRASNPDGPVFRSKKTDFSYLQYGSNGEIEQFTKVVRQGSFTDNRPVDSEPRYIPAPVDRSRAVATSEGIRFGLKGGIQSATQSGGYFTLTGLSTKGILGFQVGLLLDVPLNTALTVRPQLLYSGKGCTLINGNVSSYKTNYLEVPVDVLYKIPTSSGQLLLGGGGYFGYTLGGKIGTRDAKIGSAQKDDFTTTDFGLRLSGWYDLSAGLTLNVFYNLGLSNINPSVGLIDPAIRNRTFGLGVGYFLSR
ncbi:outer membrane protein with beta-barrel domain [Spirosoma oryzae]|uniref:Outer membrane protein with beta-barrel domain n=1 Tax=Spirosoma oryzae TaxID=1469603 RepID=A0A2T0S554_9BACT|nr:outer membrane beta-barrel protein [Spirosoma oryzae]PRY28550.1 outer membrane protein with beta-barrel domain [Spirosoma oryzae]